MGLLAVVHYDPAMAGSFTSNGSVNDLDSTNLKATFVAPALGEVLVRLTALLQGDNAAPFPAELWWSVRNEDNDILVEGEVYKNLAFTDSHVVRAFVIDGLVPGAETTIKFSVRNSSAAGAADYTHKWGGGDGGYGGTTIEVWATV